MIERAYDEHLGIHTRGISQWQDNSPHYNRLEPTPYKALDKLTESYSLCKKDKLVDFGCGRGRVLFYMHSKFETPVVGIDYDSKSYEEAISNKYSYLDKQKNINAPILLVNGLAQAYEIKDDENKFYFFNPFSIKIFKLVVNNILESVKIHKRHVDIILYYPLAGFKLIKQIPLENLKDKEEAFLIYSL